MGIESIEHIVRNRVRMFLRNTWLVAILGTLLVGAGIYGAIYVTIAPTDMRIAAGPAGGTGVKFVQLLTERFASEHDKIRLHLVTTDGPKESAEAIAHGRADLAILPSTTRNSLVWPVVAIVRQNVMALIVPASPASAPPKKETTPPPKKEEGAGAGKGEKAGKGGKEAKDTKKAVVAAKGAKDAKSTSPTPSLTPSWSPSLTPSPTRSWIPSLTPSATPSWSPSLTRSLTPSPTPKA